MEQQRKVKFSAGSPLSWIMFISLRDLYFSELKKVLTTNASRNKMHGYTMHGITAFPIAGAVWEAIINEYFTSDLVSHDYKKNLLFDIIDEADKWDIKTKTLMFPKFLFGRTFDNSQSFYSDFTSLIQIRNNIVHYKHSLYEGPDKAVRNLRTQKVTYPKPDNIDCPWQMELFSTECIRFCVNTISEFAKALSDLETPIYRQMCIPIRPEIFSPITDQQVKEEFKKHNTDPESVHNDMFGKIESSSTNDDSAKTKK